MLNDILGYSPLDILPRNANKKAVICPARLPMRSPCGELVKMNA